MQKPPPLPQKTGLLAVKLLSISAVAIIAIVAILLTLVVAGFLRIYTIPTDGMKPALPSGDQVVMEGITYLVRKPRHGEIVAYKTASLDSSQMEATFARRIAGIPGDSLRISDGKLYVNGQHLPLSNVTGEIRYENLTPSQYLKYSDDSVTVPPGHYFVLGDNSAHSADSRFSGFVPAKNIKGRILFRK